MDQQKRELIELSGKALGYEVVWVGDQPARKLLIGDGLVEWNPLDDGGDAMTLASRLRMCCDFAHGRITWPGGELEYIPFDFGEPMLSITSVAASIAREARV